MSNNLEVGVKITADGKGLVGEARAGAEALRKLGETAKSANNESASAAERFTANLKRQADTLGMTSAQVRAYDAAQMEMTQAQRASVEASNRAITSYENQQVALDDLKTLAAAAGIALGTSLVAGLKASITAAGQAEQSHLRLEAVLKATGYAAGLTKADLDSMAGGMKERLGIGDAALRDSMAVLLTFRNVSRDSFGEALEVSADLAAVMQTDLKSAVLQLGKALESPDEGLMALKRSGVSFSETQKDMIRDLVETGRQAEAITLILKTMKEKGLDDVSESMNQGITQAARDASMAWGDLLETVGGTDTVKSGVETVFGSFTGYLKDMRQVIESGDWLDRLAFFTIGLKTPDMIAKSNAPAAAADPAQQALADEGLARQKAAQQAEIAAIAKKKSDEEAAKAAEEASKRAIAAARAREEAERRAYQQSIDGANRIIAALKLETEQIGLNAIQKKMLVAATESAKAPTEELAQEIMASAQAWALATQRQEELMAAEKDRLEGIKAVEKAEQDAARAAEESARQTQQQWNQTWSSMEQTGKNAFTQFAAHGKSALGSIKESLKLSVIDLLYQVTARPWIIQLGTSLQSSFVGASGASGANALNALNLGSGTLNLIKSGFGTSSLIRSGLGAIGLGASSSASAGVFGAGGLSYLGGAGTAIGGSSLGAGGTVAASAAEFGSMASMGSAFAAAAGPAIAIAAVDQITRLLAGDKLIGGGVGKILNYVPVLGPLLNGLFGRGPLKQRGTSLTGEIGAEGFESGMLQTRFVASGGLFRSDKTDFARVDAMTGKTWTDNRKLQGFADDLAKTAHEVFGLINDTTKHTSTSLRQIGKDLGISTEGIDKFGYSLSILSDKGKMLTEEQIGQEIEKITDGLARSLLPQVDELAKRGETALQTVARLGNEFTTLVSATALVLGKSSADAKAMISGGTYQGRTAFVDAAGGLDALNQKVAFFADNFLTEAERLAPVQGKVNDELKRLGLSSDLTRDQFRGLVQSFGQVNGISEETLQALLTLAPAFAQVRDQTNNLAKEQAGAAFSGLQKTVEAEKSAITQQYNDALKTVNGRIEEVSGSIGKLKTLSDALKSTVDQIRPMGRDQAKQQIRDAIAAASAGNVVQLESVRAGLGVLSNSQTIGGFSGSFEFAREQAKTAILVADLGKLTDDQLTLDERSLAALEAQRDRLTAGFEAETARLDGLLTQGQAQIEALNGISTGVASLADALKQFNAASYSAGGGTIGGESLGNPAISAQQIRDYVNTPGRTNMEIYNAAKANGVSFEQYAAATGANVTDLYAWADKNNVPKFAKGGFHRGGLAIVGDGGGPELISTGPARITSNNDLTKLLSNEDVVEQLALLLKELQKNSEINGRVANKLDAVTQGGTTLRMKQIA